MYKIFFSEEDSSINLTNNNKQNTNQLLLLLIAIFIYSRVLLYLAGVHIDFTTLNNNWQFLDTQDLQHNLFQSLFYLHSQPPGFNFFLGIVLNLFHGYEYLTFQIIYALMGFGLVIIMFKIFTKLNIPDVISFPLIIFFAISPPTILYENRLMYTYPVTFFITLSCLLLYNYLDTRKAIYAFLFFFVLAIIVLTRSLFHLIWYLVIVLGVILYNRNDFKKIVLCALFPGLIIFSFYLKNFIVFKHFSLSSWFGMNLANMTLTIPVENIVPLIHQSDDLSEIAIVKPFSRPEDYEKYVNFDTTTGIPALDKKYKSKVQQINFNHISYVSISNQYFMTSKYLINKFPGYYVKSVGLAFCNYLKPSSDFPYPVKGIEVIKPWTSFYENYLTGNILQKIWHKSFTSNRYRMKMRVYLNFLFFFIPLFYIWGILLSIRGSKMLNLNAKDLIVLRYITFNITYITLIGNLLEIYDNMRYRFIVVPFFYILVGLFLKKMIKSK